MQKLTSTICKNVAVGTEGILTDTRDGKNYWVAKLKDNNCWMTQNLDYDDPNSAKVSAPSGWTSTSNTYRAYYDPGDKVITEPTIKVIASEPDAWTITDNDNFIAATQYVGTDAQTICTKTANTLAPATNTTPQCKIYYHTLFNKNAPQHYYAGNYYSFLAATNGTGSSVTSDGANASGSICPTNWKLPTSKVTTSGSFGGLTSAYGISSNAAGSTALRSSPLYFQYGGGVWSGSLNNAGSNGWYWSSTASGSTAAYFLDIRSDYVNPSNTANRYFGLPVRCLVQGS